MIIYILYLNIEQFNRIIEDEDSSLLTRQLLILFFLQANQLGTSFPRREEKEKVFGDKT